MALQFIQADKQQEAKAAIIVQGSMAICAAAYGIAAVLERNDILDLLDRDTPLA